MGGEELRAFNGIPEATGLHTLTRGCSGHAGAYPKGTWGAGLGHLKARVLLSAGGGRSHAARFAEARLAEKVLGGKVPPGEVPGIAACSVNVANEKLKRLNADLPDRKSTRLNSS